MADDTYESFRFEQSQEEATAAGFEVFKGNPNALLLDLDNEEAYNTYKGLQPLMAESFGSVELRRWRSKSGQGWHVILGLPEPWSIKDRIALQAALGSDGKREILAILLVEQGIEEPSLLYRPPNAKDES